MFSPRVHGRLPADRAEPSKGGSAPGAAISGMFSTVSRTPLRKYLMTSAQHAHGHTATAVNHRRKSARAYRMVPDGSDPKGTGPSLRNTIVPSRFWAPSWRKSETFTRRSCRKRQRVCFSVKNCPIVSVEYVCHPQTTRLDTAGVATQHSETRVPPQSSCACAGSFRALQYC
jgi:hypothetical protein